MFGLLKMGDIKKNIFITVYDVDNGQLEIFNNIEEKYKNVFLVDILTASLAAPTYFPVKKIILENQDEN